MRSMDVGRVFDASGPFLSLYLATGGDLENAGPRVELRWKNVRGEQLLRERSPKRVRELVKVVGGELASVSAVLDEAAELVAAQVEHDTRVLLDRFEQERGRPDRAADEEAAAEGRLVDVAVRAALTTGAGVRVLGRDTVGPGAPAALRTHRVSSC